VKNLNRIIKAFSELDERLGSKSLLNSVRRGLIYMTPLVLIGSMALLFMSLPIPAYQNLMERFFGADWKNVFLYVHDSTFNILSLIMVICISYSYIVEFGEKYSQNLSPIIGASVSLCSFIAISGTSKHGFIIANFGVIGVFTAIFVSVSSAILFLKLNSIRFLRVRAFTDGANSVFSYAITSIYPAAITIAIFALINQGLTAIFGISNIQSYLSNILYNLFSKIQTPFLSSLLFISLVHIFWFFGIHGSNILDPVAQSIFVPALQINQQSIILGQAPTEIFTKTFLDTFVLMGGCGSTLCLIIAILATGKHKNQRRLAKLSFIPSIFNINELIVYGIPMMLNPIYIMPFLLVPVLLTIVSFLATYIGLVPYTINPVEWTTPIFLSGYTSTNSINGSILQLTNLILGVLFYMPFVKLAQKASDHKGKSNLKKVYDMYKHSEERGLASTLLTRYDEVGNISRFLVADLEHDLQNNKVALFYQPQVNCYGKVVGVEALLRWRHESFDYIYPPLVIALAEEAQLIDKLGYWILDTACGDLEKLYDLGLEDITVSVNISAVQLESENFIESIEEIIKKHKIRPQTLKIEITEQLALASRSKIINQIMAIKKLGIKLAMDDFGMGHSSLMYLKEYDFDTIKFDGVLVRDILSNNNCRNIISSIVFLSKSLNCSVIAEYVENEEQRKVLHELGCDQYQGYLYSKAIPYKDLIDYILNDSDAQVACDKVKALSD
jgi:lactose/cellobiose-specific phosphotransferase system IIC component